VKFYQFLQRHHDHSSVERNPGALYQVHIFAAYLSEKVFETTEVRCHEIFPTKAFVWENQSARSLLTFFLNRNISLSRSSDCVFCIQ
jgi:hypothetical protein